MGSSGDAARQQQQVPGVSPLEYVKNKIAEVLRCSDSTQQPSSSCHQGASPESDSTNPPPEKRARLAEGLSYRMSDMPSQIKPEPSSGGMYLSRPPPHGYPHTSGRSPAREDMVTGSRHSPRPSLHEERNQGQLQQVSGGHVTSAEDHRLTPTSSTNRHEYRREHGPHSTHSSEAVPAYMQANKALGVPEVSQARSPNQGMPADSYSDMAASSSQHRAAYASSCNSSPQPGSSMPRSMDSPRMLAMEKREADTARRYSPASSMDTAASSSHSGGGCISTSQDTTYRADSHHTLAAPPPPRSSEATYSPRPSSYSVHSPHPSSAHSPHPAAHSPHPSSHSPHPSSHSPHPSQSPHHHSSHSSPHPSSSAVHSPHPSAAPQMPDSSRYNRFTSPPDMSGPPHARELATSSSSPAPPRGSLYSTQYMYSALAMSQQMQAQMQHQHAAAQMQQQQQQHATAAATEAQQQQQAQEISTSSSANQRKSSADETPSPSSAASSSRPEHNLLLSAQYETLSDDD